MTSALNISLCIGTKSIFIDYQHPYNIILALNNILSLIGYLIDLIFDKGSDFQPLSLLHALDGQDNTQF